MVHIRTVKTFSGEKRYAVVSKIVTTMLDEKGKEIPRVEFLPVDYKVKNEIYPAVFPHTKEGLQKAKEIQKIYKK